jgi:hypothetical protein
MLDGTQNLTESEMCDVLTFLFFDVAIFSRAASPRWSMVIAATRF